MFKSPEKFGNYQGNQFAYRELPKFKNAVQELEGFNELTTQDRVAILATALDLRPASLIGFRISISNKEIQHLENILTDLGVFFEETDLPHVRDELHLLIGGTPETIAAAIASGSPAKNDDSFGAAMGYPSTAVTTFSEARASKDDIFNTVLSREEEREKLTPEERAFKFFMFSREHYEQEVEYLEQVIAAIKEYAPNLYQKIIDESSLVS